MSMPKCKCGHEIQDTGKNPDQWQGQVNQDYKIQIMYMCMNCGQEYEAVIPFSKFMKSDV